MKLEEVCHDLNLQQTRFVDNGTSKNLKANEDKLQDDEVMPFRAIKKQIENNYSEIQLATAKMIMQKMGTTWGAKKLDVET